MNDWKRNAMASTWIYADEAEEIYGGPIPPDADVITHVCASDGLTVFEGKSVIRAARRKENAGLDSASDHRAERGDDSLASPPAAGCPDSTGPAVDSRPPPAQITDAERLDYLIDSIMKSNGSIEYCEVLGGRWRLADDAIGVTDFYPTCRQAIDAMIEKAFIESKRAELF